MIYYEFASLIHVNGMLYDVEERLNTNLSKKNKKDKVVAIRMWNRFVSLALANEQA